MSLNKLTAAAITALSLAGGIQEASAVEIDEKQDTPGIIIENTRASDLLAPTHNIPHYELSLDGVHVAGISNVHGEVRSEVGKHIPLDPHVPYASALALNPSIPDFLPSFRLTEPTILKQHNEQHGVKAVVELTQGAVWNVTEGSIPEAVCTNLAAGPEWHMGRLILSPEAMFALENPLNLGHQQHVTHALTGAENGGGDINNNKPNFFVGGGLTVGAELVHDRFNLTLTPFGGAMRHEGTNGAHWLPVVGGEIGADLMLGGTDHSLWGIRAAVGAKGILGEQPRAQLEGTLGAIVEIK